MTETGSEPVAFIGLGSMGLRMARNLVQAGFDVRGHDTNGDALRVARESGITTSDRAVDTARDADVLVLMVVDAAQAESILFERDAIAAMREGGTVVLMSTCPPRVVATLADRVAAAGRTFLDAPVSGGTAGAEAGSLTVMAAGKPQVFEKVRPILQAMGRKVLHVGTAPGQGAVVKAVNQLLCGVHIAAAAEGLALARKLGVDPHVILDICGGSAAASWILNDRGPRMIEPDPPVSSAVDIFVKDLGIVLEAGRDSKAALPLAAVAHQLFLATSGRGDGQADDSQVIRSYAALNGG